MPRQNTTFNIRQEDQARKPGPRVGIDTLVGLIILLILLGMATMAPTLAPFASAHSPIAINLDSANLPIASFDHILGTDYLGRDIFSRALWGARASLFVGIVAATLAVAIGSLWGSIGALFGGIIDATMMRIVDGLLSIPAIILLLVFQSLLVPQALASRLPEPLLHLMQVHDYTQGLLPFVTVILVISATSWLEAARLAHAQVLSIKQQEYVEAAYALGLSRSQLLLAHVLPNCAFILVIEACLLVSDAVLAEAGLSFLGLGLGPAIPSWGGMLAASEPSLIQGNWWAAVIPGLLITACVLSVNLIGRGYLGITRSRHHQVVGQPEL